MPQEGFPFNWSLAESWSEHPLVMGGKRDAVNNRGVSVLSWMQFSACKRTAIT